MPAAAKTAPSPAPAASPAPAQTAARAATPGVVELKMELNEYKFTPSQVQVPVGTRVRVTVVNTGARRHDFSVAGLIEGKTLEAGATEVMEFTAAKAGEFEILCTLRGHKDRGMVGTLVVK